MRELTEHKVNPANDRIYILVTDEPGAGGAHHRYEIGGFDVSNNPSFQDFEGYTAREGKMTVLFQNGPIPEAGVNGITQEVLLAIVADRLRSFQAGPYACIENQNALEHVEAAMEALLARTRKRMARGVEGTHVI